MSMKLLEAVYQLDKNATTATEQAVLAALAFRANDKTHLCFPKQETIAAMTHLHRATVVSCLNSLRERGFLEWKSGGLTKKRGKYGQPLANDYTLKIPVGKEKTKVNEQKEPVHNSGAMSSTTTLQCRPGRHCNVAQDDTNRNNNRKSNRNTEPKGESSGVGFRFCFEGNVRCAWVGRQNGK